MHPKRPSLESVWWLHPGKLILLFVLPIYAFVVFVVPGLWPELIVLRAPVYMHGEFSFLGAVAIALAGVTALLGGTFSLTRRPRAPWVIDERFLLVIGGLTIAAYLVWFWPVIARGELFLTREELNQTPGITSFSQLGVPFVIGYALNTVRARRIPSPSLRAMYRAIVVLTLARVYLHSERLAFIEVFVPIAAIGLSYATPRRALLRGAFVLLRRYGPFLGIPVLLVFFGVTEFFRSWASYSQTQDISVVDFMISRVATYYYTALNNGAGLLATSEWPTFEPVHVFDWAYRLPAGIGQFLWEGVTRPGSPSDAFLGRFADPEFNNMSGIFPIFFDLGIPGGLAYFALLGFAMGVAYREAIMGGPLGSLLFPPLLVACSELLRITYLNDARCFLILVGAFAASTQVRTLYGRRSARKGIAHVAQEGHA